MLALNLKQARQEAVMSGTNETLSYTNNTVAFREAHADSEQFVAHIDMVVSMLKLDRYLRQRLSL